MTEKETAEDIAGKAEDYTEVNTSNEWGLIHRTKTYGMNAMVGPSYGAPRFKTRQACYRFAAWLLYLAENLPEEDVPATFEEVKEAVENA